MNNLISPKMLIRQCISLTGSLFGIYQSRIKKLAKSGNSLILMYHRIVNPSSDAEYLEPGMYVKPETFAMQCSVIKKYFSVVPVSQIFKKQSDLSKKPLCAITFDDGWVDFLTNAAPVLKSQELPATVYLPTNYIDTDKRFWTDNCALIFKNLFSRTTWPQYYGADTNLRILLHKKNDLFTQVDTAIRFLKPLSIKEIDKTITELADFSGVTDKFNRAFLNWDEVRALKKSNLVSFGSHTSDHLILSAESDQVTDLELIDSKQKLINEKAVDPDCISFCYPNGGFTQSISEKVKSAGYTFAVTTKFGWNNSKSDLFALKRVGIHQDMTSTKSLILSRIGRMSP